MPYALCPLKSSLDNLEQESVRNFDMSVSLWVGGGEVVISDPQLRAKIPEGVVIELFPIVWNQDSRDPKSACDVSPDEISHVLLRNGGQGFNFHPFCEVFYAHYEELQLLYHYWEWPHDV